MKCMKGVWRARHWSCSIFLVFEFDDFSLSQLKQVRVELFFEGRHLHCNKRQYFATDSSRKILFFVGNRLNSFNKKTSKVQTDMQLGISRIKLFNSFLCQRKSPGF